MGVSCIQKQCWSTGRDAPILAALTSSARACSVREQRRSVTVLLAGTSGTGKSTLAGLLAARLGITTVVSTDSVRNMLRSFAGPDEDPLLWASTYQARPPASSPIIAALTAWHACAPGPLHVLAWPASCHVSESQKNTVRQCDRGRHALRALRLCVGCSGHVLKAVARARRASM